jgi:hypothetical protein
LPFKINKEMKMTGGHASTSGGLLHREASQARVFQFYLKIGRGAIAGGARGIIMEAVWK